MLPKEILLIWLLIVNIAAVSLFIFAWLRLPISNYRTLFLYFLLPYSAWANCLFLIQILGHEHNFSRLVSQTIFASGAFYHVILGTLLISMAAPTVIKGSIFRLLMLNTILVGVCSYLNFWEMGVSYDITTGLAPIPSSLLWYFNTSLLVWALYYFSVVVVAFIKMRARDILRCQLKLLVWPVIFSMTMSLTTNVIIPAITNNYSLTAIGGFWLFVFFAAIAYIIRLGQAILLFESIKDFENRLAVAPGPTYEELGELVRASILRSIGIEKAHTALP